MEIVPSVAVIFHRLGPYHHARLVASARHLKVLAIEESSQTAEYAWDELRSVGDDFQRVTLLQKKGQIPQRPAAEIARRIYNVLDKHRPTVIAIPGWSDPAALAALSWGLANGVPCIVMSESTAFDEPRRSWKERIKSQVVRLCAAGLVGGTPHAEYLETLGLPRARIFTGYDAVDNEHFSAGAQVSRAREPFERARLGLPNRYFLASNRFVEQKNLPMLLQSFARYHRAGGKDAWKLVLLGAGPLRAELLELRAKLGLAGSILMPGFKQYDELPAYYGLAGAFVHASSREPWGLVVNEAMAAGLPVIVSNRCGCAHDLVLHGKNGFTFDPNDPNQLAEQMAKVADASTITRSEMGAVSRHLVEKWSPERFAENLLRAVEVGRALPLPHANWLDRFVLWVLIWKANRQARRLLPTT